MATTRSFSTMLNDYLPNKLLKAELTKRDYLLNKVDKDDSWVGGPLIVPFKSAGASSVAFGALTASDDIAEDAYVRGSVSSQKEIWGSMVFNHRDLMEHDAVSEKNLLKILPDAIEDFMDLMKNAASVSLLNGAHFATLTGDGQAGGTMVVDRPDRFDLGQKIVIDDSDSSPVDAYVTAINMNTKTITVSATRGGGALNISAYTVAQAAKCYHPGSQASGFSSVRAALLSAANGGDSALYGVTKTTAPFLQAINVDGSDITSQNILEKIFDAFVTIRQLGKGNPSDLVMSYKTLGACMKVIELSKGAYNVAPGSQKASQYGWTEIEVGSVTKGGLKLIGVQEMDDDVIMCIDWRALTFHSNGFFKKRKSPDGLEYFETRATTGYSYIVDICCFGDLVVKRPSYCGIIHSISFTL